MVKFRLGVESDVDKFAKLHCVGGILEMHEITETEEAEG